MRYICIKCGLIWIVDGNTEESSGGICDACIIEYIRARQLAYGFHDCFRRNKELCSDTKCSYWDICNKYYLVKDNL